MIDATADLRSPAGLLALQSLPKVGPMTALRTALGASLRPQLLDRLDRSNLTDAFAAARSRLADCERAGVDVVTFFDERYPDRLRLIDNPPPLLFVRGNVDLLRREALAAVVGTREPTSFGIGATQLLTRALAQRCRCGIVSGLARGIDTVAHRTALELGAPTIAVMGGGLDRVYPAENARLASEILELGGTLISEQPFGVPPRPSHLIARDRIQSGLSVAVLVGQSGIKSGTMHTVRFAASQGRPVFCPEPRSSEVANAGLRVLLQEPASDLCRLLPAWKTAQRLCERLGEQPLAHAVTRDGVEHFADAVSHSISHEDPGCAPGALFTLPV